MSTLRSTLDFRSNLYPVVADEVRNDEAFLRALRDPIALEKYRESASRYQPTPSQREAISKGIGISCSLAPNDDYPWGTVITDDGEHVVCRCEQYDCVKFSECRPEFDLSQVQIVDACDCEDKMLAVGNGSDERASDPASIEEANQDEHDSSCDGQTRDTDSRVLDLDEFSLEEFLLVPDDPMCGQDEGTLFELDELDAPCDDILYEFDELEQTSYSAKPEASFAHEGGLEREEPSLSAERAAPGDGAQPDQPDQLDGIGLSSAGPERVASVETIIEVATNVDAGLADNSSGYDCQQARIIEAEPSKRMYVNAGPGTGKTHTLIEKLKYLIDRQGVSPEDITVLSFTRAAVSVVQSRLSAAARCGEIDASWQDILVTTIDKLASLILFESAESQREKGWISRCGYETRIVKAAEAVRNNPKLLESHTHFIVDETQDLVTCRADFVLSILELLPQECGFTLFGDRCQGIYEYQVKQSKKGSRTTSEEFYRKVLEMPMVSEILLEKNYRQLPSFPLDLSGMREHLLQGKEDLALDDIAGHVSELGLPENTLDKEDDEAIAKLLGPSDGEGSIGLLSLYNAEALELETALWKRGVICEQARSDADCKSSRCFADALFEHEGATIDRETFEQRCLGSDPHHDGRVWRALMRLDGIVADGGRVKVERVLSALYDDALPPAVSAVRTKPSRVVVSNIHQAKGREFDTVLLLAEDLRLISESGDLERAKVGYVGLSRARSAVRLTSLQAGYLEGEDPIDNRGRNKQGRYYRASGIGRLGRGRRRAKKRVVNFEIRNARDIDFGSFAELETVQQRLRNDILEGAEVRLERRNREGRIRYVIVAILDDGRVELGSMTDEFASDYAQCSGKSGASAPDAFDDVFIDRVVSCVDMSDNAPEYAKRFGNMAIWYGVTLGGFAHRDDSQGY